MNSRNSEDRVIPRGEATYQRQRYQQYVKRHQLKHSQGNAPKQPMTYQEYILGIDNVEKLFEPDEKVHLSDKLKQTSIAGKKQANRGIQLAKRLVLLIWQQLKQVRKSKNFWTISAGVTLSLIIVSAIFIWLPRPTDEIDQVAGFTVIKSNSSSGSQILIDDDAKVASFQDKINDSTVTISQQPLTPDQIANKQELIANFTQRLSAFESFETNKGTVYYTESTNLGGQQTFFFIDKDTIVFIRTTNTTIEQSAWQDYINNLVY